MHDCPCCGDIIYTAPLLCGACEHHGCEPNREGAYDDCQRPCENCGVPGLADFYFCLIYEDEQGETTYVDGYVCADHATEDGLAYVPAGGRLLEFTLTELDR